MCFGGFFGLGCASGVLLGLFFGSDVLGVCLGVRKIVKNMFRAWGCLECAWVFANLFFFFFFALRANVCEMHC